MQISKAKFLETIGHYNGFLLDKWGVLSRGSEFFPNVHLAVAMMQGIGPLFLLSNDSSTLPEDHYQGLLANGINIPTAKILTSGMLLHPCFEERGLIGKKVLNVGDQGGGEYIKQAGGVLLEEPVHIDDIEVVVVTRHIGFSERTKRLATIAIVRGVPAIETNADMFAPIEGGQLLPVAGSIAREIAQEDAFTWLGKPHRPVWEFAFSHFDGIPRENILMIDDSLENIMAAIEFGFHGLLVYSGVTSEEVEGELDSGLIRDWKLHTLPSISILD